VFVTTAGGVALTCATIVYTTLPPTGNVLNVSLSAPLPLHAVSTTPLLGTHVHVWLAIPAGNGSLTVVPLATTLPVFVTVTVYVTVPPGVSAPTALEVFAMLTCGADGFEVEQLAGAPVAGHAPEVSVTTFVAGVPPEAVTCAG
jgi:hypothetical protein